MGNFEFEQCGDFEGLYLIHPKVHGDSRGYFMETFQSSEFKKHGIDVNFVQDNQSLSSRGVLRGLHYQKEHTQGKLVRVLQGQIYDAVVDIRKSSKTYGQWYGVQLDAEQHTMFYVPEGFAHGFYVMSEMAVFFYKCTDYYDPASEAGILWNDEALGIKWPIPEGEKPLISEKDEKHPLFSDAIYLDY
ncbi:MAG: dTDP-4-dehydrorhamnose 3,5-epimerase [Lachnospiraceae bacterium]|nr:dTDP-4-dehydrorhamnose 3,5-epimerase [Lachnospiraceae bacterium]